MRFSNRQGGKSSRPPDYVGTEFLLRFSLDEDESETLTLELPTVVPPRKANGARGLSVG